MLDECCVWGPFERVGEDGAVLQARCSGSVEMADGTVGSWIGWSVKVEENATTDVA